MYKDEKGKTYFQQDLDSPLVGKEEAGGKEAFMALCDKRQEEWKTKVLERRRNGFLHIDGDTGFIYEHRPVVRYRGFVKLVYDGELVYIMNIREERFIAYHNWEIRADDGICTIGNKLYLKSNKDGKALWIRKRSGDFQVFVVDEPMMMIINKYGKEIEKKRVYRE